MRKDAKKNYKNIGGKIQGKERRRYLYRLRDVHHYKWPYA